MTGPTSFARALLVHAAVYVSAALVLLAKAQPVDWDTPTNLEYEMGWGFYIVVIVIVAGVLGALEGGFLGRGHLVPGWLFTALAAGVGVSGAAFFIDKPFAYGDEVWTASSGDVTMSQGLWFAFWMVQTVVATISLALLGRSGDPHPHASSNGAVAT
jgi:hypothetical protein